MAAPFRLEVTPTHIHFGKYDIPTGEIAEKEDITAAMNGDRSYVRIFSHHGMGHPDYVNLRVDTTAEKVTELYQKLMQVHFPNQNYPEPKNYLTDAPVGPNGLPIPVNLVEIPDRDLTYRISVGGVVESYANGWERDLYLSDEFYAACERKKLSAPWEKQIDTPEFKGLLAQMKAIEAKGREVSVVDECVNMYLNKRLTAIQNGDL